MLKLVILLFGFSKVSAGGVSVFVNEGDSVTLDTGDKTDQQEKIKWYFNDRRIAEISTAYNNICTDDECKESFRDRLKLDQPTGSLTITNTRETDSGLYKAVIFNGSSSKKTFDVSIYVVSAADRDEVTRVPVKEGEPVTLDLGGIRNTSDVMMWYFNDIRIAKITDQIQICTDEECDRRFRHRLKVDNHTGSLIITNTTNTDAGEYKLQISNRFSVSKSFHVDVASTYSGQPSDSGRGIGSSVPLGVGVIFGLLIVFGIVGVIYNYQAKRNGNKGSQRKHQTINKPQPNKPDSLLLMEVNLDPAFNQDSRFQSQSLESDKELWDT